jgi:hypothetical protein
VSDLFLWSHSMFCWLISSPQCLTMVTIRPGRDEVDTWVRVGETTSMLLLCHRYHLASTTIAGDRDTLFLDHMTRSAASLDCPHLHTNLQALLKLDIDCHPAIATDNCFTSTS